MAIAFMDGQKTWLFALAKSLTLYHVQNADINPKIHEMPSRGCQSHLEAT